jgi:hypothetical protein
MTTDRYAALRAALEAGPTPGRRYRGRGPHSYCVYDKECWHAPDGSRHGETPNLVIVISPEDAEADAALIAAADPGTIAALLKERDEALSLLARAEKCISSVVRIEQCAHDEPPSPVSEWDDEADRLAAEIRAALAAQERT